MHSRRWWLVVAATLMAAATPAEAAQPAHVSVVRAEGADSIIQEITNRTRAELTAAGLDAAIVDCSAGDAGCGDAAPVAAGGGARAVVTTARDGQDTVTEVKVAAPAQASPLVLRLTVGVESADYDDPATLAVRAAELVRSALLQAEAPAPPPPPPPHSSSEEISYDFEQPRQQAQAASGSGWFVGAAAAMLGAIGGFSPGFGPALRGGYAGTRWPALAVGVWLAAPVWSADLSFRDGHVILRQEVAALQASWRFRAGSRLQPRLSLGAGIYHLTALVVAVPGSPFLGNDASVWEPMVSTGGGAAFMVTRRMAFFVEVQAIFVRMAPDLVADGQPIGGAAEPSFLVSTGVEHVF
jgi:hypothetical protein